MYSYITHTRYPRVFNHIGLTCRPHPVGPASQPIPRAIAHTAQSPTHSQHQSNSKSNPPRPHTSNARANTPFPHSLATQPLFLQGSNCIWHPLLSFSPYSLDDVVVHLPFFSFIIKTCVMLWCDALFIPCVVQLCYWTTWYFFYQNRGHPLRFIERNQGLLHKKGNY